MNRPPLRHATLWSLISLFVFIVTFAGVWIINRLFIIRHGGAPALSDGVLIALLVALCTTGFMSGFGFLIIMGAIAKDEPRDEKRPEA